MLNKIIRTETKEMSNCAICPRQCNIIRSVHAGENTGFCGEGETMRISRAALHFWEEPRISGETGSGAVFFTGCNLKCIFCQNAAISENGHGYEVSEQELVNIFFDLKRQGAININLVTPSHFVPRIRKTLILAREEGFDLPFVYNSSAYESVETLRTLEGLIDIYLPDFKYMFPDLAKKYSHAEDYPEVAKKAIAEMVRQVGKQNVIVRHLLLPLAVKNAIATVDYIYDTYGDDISLSLMSQYTPLYGTGKLTTEQEKRLAAFPDLHRKVTRREYDKLLQHCFDRNITNVYIQEGDVASESFIPDFYDQKDISGK